MSPVGKACILDESIAKLFSKTPVRREMCDKVAKELVGGNQIVPVPHQGWCSYTVYAGPDLGHVVQFRLKSFELKIEIATLAERIFGSLAPDVSFIRQLGEDLTTAGQEPLLVYVMTRMPGINGKEYIVADKLPENSPEAMARRMNLIQDIARFFALSWKAPQGVDQAYRNRMAETFEKDLQLLLAVLPERFYPIIRATLTSLPSILCLPMVLIHEDFGPVNIMVEENSNRLVGVIDWAEAQIGPFGTNLEAVQSLMSKLHLKNGRIRYQDYHDLEHSFWETLSHEVGGLRDDTIKAIKAARVLGLLRSRGFTLRLGNVPEPVPNKDDDEGRYNTMILDGLLLDPVTRFEGLDEWLKGVAAS